MKPLVMTVLLLFLLFSCSEVETTDDAILGTWMNQLQSEITIEGKSINEQEWIFNDLNKGRFHGYKDGKIVYNMDYSWTNKNGVYTLTYYGGNLSVMTFRMEETILRAVEGQVVAFREE